MKFDRDITGRLSVENGYVVCNIHLGNYVVAGMQCSLSDTGLESLAELLGEALTAGIINQLEGFRMTMLEKIGSS